MAANSRAYTLACAAAMLGEDEELLHAISVEMEPGDGAPWIFATGEDGTTAFTDYGIEMLGQLIEIHGENEARIAGRAKTE
ncbi:MAG: hypothetical protein RIB84_25445 [Sneathiellaceae bacterium]